jgi:hypothetical protein
MSKRLFSATAVLAICIASSGSAFAGSISTVGSDNSTDTYAGDTNWFGLPSGTFALQQYLSYNTSNQYIATPAVPQTNANVFSTLTGGTRTSIPSTLDYQTATTRLSYYTNIFGLPLMLEGAARYERVNTVNVGNFPSPIGGLGPQSQDTNTFDNPELSAGLGLGVIADARSQRFLAVKNYFYLPSNFDNTKQFNVNPPRIFTWVPQLAYSEGLAKFGLTNLWVDLIGNASVHSQGDSPLALAPGVQFDKLTQSTSYDMKAFVRYETAPLNFVAVGIEKSWGGNQLASGGILELIFGGPQSFGMDDFTKGHVQFGLPLPYDFQLAADISHDFQRDGGFKENVGAELRITKLFMPSAPPARMFPTK